MLDPKMEDLIKTKGDYSPKGEDIFGSIEIKMEHLMKTKGGYTPSGEDIFGSADSTQESKTLSSATAQNKEGD